MRKLVLLGVACAAALVLGAGASDGPPKGMAILKLPSKATGLTAELALTTGGKVTLTSKGTTVKPGTYDVKQITLFMADDKKVVWSLVSTNDTGALDRFMVDEDQEKVIDVGPPILFRLRAWRPGAETEVDISCDVIGRSREKYFPNAAPAGKRPGELPYEVLDEDGKTVLASGHMGFKNNIANATWNPPKNYHRKFTVKIAPDMGPFEWKYYDDYTGQSRPDAK